jgi:hypothetical protein
VRTVLALLLLCLALVGVTSRLTPACVDSCQSTDVLGAQTLDDDALDDAQWELTEPLPVLAQSQSPVPESRPDRHTPRLHDERRYPPPRA